MLFRGVVKNGQIAVPAAADLPDGAEVLVYSIPVAARGQLKPKIKTIRGFGMWKARKDIKNTAAFAARLRKSAAKRSKRG